jgi:hypothetical protein
MLNEGDAAPRPGTSPKATPAINKPRPVPAAQKHSTVTRNSSSLDDIHNARSKSLMEAKEILGRSMRA